VRPGPQTAALLTVLLLTTVVVGSCGRRHGLAKDAGTADGGDDGATAGGDARDADDADVTSAPPPETPDAGADALDGDAPVEAAEPECDAGTADGGDASPWQPLGPELGAVADAGVTMPSLALVDGTQPVVAWQENHQIETRVWKEIDCVGAWSTLGVPVAGDFPALAAGAQGLVRTYLKAGTTQIIVDRWNGSAFVPLGDPLSDPSSSPMSSRRASAVATDAAGNPVVAWGSGIGTLTNTVQVQRWDGARWVSLSDSKGVLAGITFGTVLLSPVSLSLAPDGRPLVSWANFARVTAVAKFDTGTTWNALGTSPESFPSFENNGPVVRVNGAGDVFVAWMTRAMNGAATHVTVARFDAGAWSMLGMAPSTGAVGQDYDLAIDRAGAPILVEEEETFGAKATSLFAYRWTGTAWTAGSALPGTETTTTVMPHIAIDRRGRWVVAWAESSAGHAGVVRVARREP
jgi:hypothetical protein